MQFKYTYNTERNMPEPLWGPKAEFKRLVCPACKGKDMHWSAHPDSPTEVGHGTVRCGACGLITDLFESMKAGER